MPLPVKLRRARASRVAVLPLPVKTLGVVHLIGPRRVAIRSLPVAVPRVGNPRVTVRPSPVGIPGAGKESEKQR